jgi:hypothetical protein
MGDNSVATPPPPPAPGNPYGQPNPYQQAQPGPYDQPNPYVQPGQAQVSPQANPYAQPGQAPVPPQGSPYGGQIPPQAGPYGPQDTQGGYPPPPPAYGYPQQQPPVQQMQPMPSGDWAMPAPNSVTCRFCGGFPAVATTVRAHRGLIILMYFRRLPGPFCKTCGTAAVRDMSAQTLVQGWWGYASSIITPITLFINLFAYNKIKALPDPAPNPPGPPMNPGKPLLQRPHALGFLLPVIGLIILIAAVASSASNTDSPSSAGGDGYPVSSFSVDNAVVGDCVQNDGTDSDPDVHIVTCTPGTMQVVPKLTDTTSDTGCPAGVTKTYTQTAIADDFVLCQKDYTG